MLPVIGHSLIIYVINQLYGKVAKWCTDLENHRLGIENIYIHHGHYNYFPYRDVHSWHNSLVVKRVLFECADCFLPLFYIAFYQFDVEALRNELIGLFYSKYKIMDTCSYTYPLKQDCIVTAFKIQAYTCCYRVICL